MTRTGFILALAVGCKGGDVAVHGSVGDGKPATAYQGGAPGGDPDRAEVAEVEDDGSLAVLAQADIAADGSFTLDVPSGAEKLVVSVVDADGRALASGLLAASGAGDVELPPLDAESTLEALVFVDLIASGEAALPDADPCDLRARIDARVAAAATVMAGANGDVVDEIHTLATSVAAAQAAEVTAWADAGVDATNADLFHAELDAVARLDAALAGGVDRAEADAAYLDDLADAAASLGVTAQTRAEAAAQATLALRAGARGHLGELEDGCLVAAAQAEARATADAAVDASAAAADAAARLRAAVDAAADADACGRAFGDFQGGIVGDGAVSGSVLADALSLDLVGSTTAQLAVDSSIAAAESLQATVSVADAVDADAAADAAVSAWATYRGAVEAAVSSIPGDTDLAAKLVVCATGSFRAR